MHGADIGTSGSSTQGDATLPPGSLCVVGLGYLGCSCWVALAFHLRYRLEVGGGQQNILPWSSRLGARSMNYPGGSYG
jgi:hypothetical protein